MLLYEYEGKKLFKSCGIEVPEGQVLNQVQDDAAVETRVCKVCGRELPIEGNFGVTKVQPKNKCITCARAYWRSEQDRKRQKRLGSEEAAVPEASASPEGPHPSPGRSGEEGHSTSSGCAGHAWRGSDASIYYIDEAGISNGAITWTAWKHEPGARPTCAASILEDRSYLSYELALKALDKFAATQPNWKKVVARTL